MQSKVQRSNPGLAGLTRASTMGALHLEQGSDCRAGMRFPFTLGGSTTGLSVTDDCRGRAVMGPACSPAFRTRWSLLLTSQKYCASDDPGAGVTGRGPLIERRRTARDIRDQAIISGITVVNFDRLG